MSPQEEKEIPELKSVAGQGNAPHLVDRIKYALQNSAKHREESADLLKSIQQHPNHRTDLAEYLNRNIIDMVRGQLPELWKMYSPRKYTDLGNWFNPEIFIAHAIAAVEQGIGVAKHGEYPSYIDIILVGALSYLSKHGMPLFFLAKDFITALTLTDFKEAVNWKELNLPYESGVLVLPRGTLKTPSGVGVQFIGWSRQTKGKAYMAFELGVGASVGVAGNDSLAVYCLVDGGQWMFQTVNDTTGYTITMANPFNDSDTELLSSHDMQLNENEEVFFQKLNSLLFGTLFAMQAKPELVERGSLVKRVKAKRAGESEKEFWAPNIIGRTYRAKSEDQGGVHNRPRMHWRRGHFRQQAHGAGMKLRKTMWIEPMLVAATAAAAGSEKEKER